MKRLTRILIGAGLLLVLFFLGRCAWEHFGGGEAEKKPEPIVRVEVRPVERKTISEKITAYGSVVAQPGKTHSVSVAFEARVRHILVAPGQFVRPNDPLIEIEPSAAAQLQVQQARSAMQSAEQGLKQTQQRFNLKLATNQEVTAAQKAAADANAQLSALERAGAGGDNRIHSDIPGVIAKVDVQDGQIVAIGNPFVEIVAEEEIEVKLGVEPEDVSALQEGGGIGIFAVNNPEPKKVDGTVRLVTRRVDPTTRLVDVYVALPAGTKLLLEGFVRGEFARTANEVLVVPLSAVLPDESGGFKIFTVEKDHAKKIGVQLDLQNERETQIVSDAVKPGDQVVVSGNYELEDGMRVAVVQPK
ncbi:MAG: efflux RND transporter periplasmic adaptor subunit [Chthoniobacterales bacterium]